MTIKSTLLAMFLSILVVGTADATMIEDFQSYADSAALQAAWTLDGGGTGEITSYTLNTDNTKYMEINAALGGAGPYYDVLLKNYGGVNWTGQGALKVDYRGTSGKSREQLEIELVKASDWSQKWQSGAWAYLNDSTWYTKTIDLSGVPADILSNIGPVRIVVKAGLDYGTTTVGVDNLQVIPEPASLLLLGSGLVGLLGFSMKKRT